VNYQGASGSLDFDPNRAVHSPWQIVNAQLNGSTKVIGNISEAEVAAARN
jgi:hypothetical protein